MIGHVKIKSRGPAPRGFARAYGNAAKTCWQETGAHWHTHFREKHFTAAGASEYRYAPRSRRYLELKRRIFGHSLPLVKTGVSRELTRMRNVRSTRKGVRVSMHSPGFNRRAKNSRVNMAQELRTVSHREAKALAGVFDKRLDDELARFNEETTEVI